MRFVAAIALILSSHAFALDMTLQVTDVYDADTIYVEFPLPEPLNRVGVRLYGIDTPEMPAKSYMTSGKLGRAQCIAEAERSISAKNYIQALVMGSDGTIAVKDVDYGKYGGRVVGRVYIGGIDVAAELIRLGMGVSYDGGTKTHDWCK